MRPNFGEDSHPIKEVKVLLVDGAGARWGSCWSFQVLLLHRLWRWGIFLGQVIHNVHQRLRPPLDSHLLPHDGRGGRQLFWADCTVDDRGVRWGLKKQCLMIKRHLEFLLLGLVDFNSF